MTEITSHVLDISRGQPAVGIGLEFWGQSLLAQSRTGPDGRSGVIFSGEIPAGVYGLRFWAGEYFARLGQESFWEVIEIRCQIQSGHYHIPLLLAPYSYTCYRGS